MRDEDSPPEVTVSGLRKALISSKVACESSRKRRVVDDGGLEYVDAGGVNKPGVRGCMHGSVSAVSVISSWLSLNRSDCLKKSMGAGQ